MQRQIAFSWLLLAIYVALPISSQVEAYPYTRSRSLWNQFQEDYPEAAQEILDRIENLAFFSQPDNTKRNLDLGLTRSFSGGQSGKHMMGMTAANYGPGRRRRSEQTQTNN